MRNRWKKAATAGTAFVLMAVLAGTSACSAEASSFFGSRDTLAVNQDTDDPDTDEDESDDAEDTVTAVITLSDKGSTVTYSEDETEGSSASGVKIDGDTIEITSEGTYEISGKLSDGQIYVEASDTDTVTLLLDGVDLTNETEPAIYAQQADKVRIKLVKGSKNQLQSGTSMPDEADENASGGTIFCRDDLVISGSGSLTVNGYINDGIHGNDDLKIKNGNIEVNAVHHAVKTNETLSIKGGSLDLTAGTDGIHSNGTVEITDGEMTISVGDDGIHAENEITIEDGTIEITRSYEGIEANLIYVKGGDISVTSRDDGFNANGGPHHFGMHMDTGTPSGSEEESETEFPELIIDDGNIYVNADGDGLDSNGDLIVNGGMIVIDGPESSNNGALDSGAENGGSCLINGGTVLAIGAAGMAERFSSSSEQASFGLSVTTKFDAGTEIMIEDENGNELFSHTSEKQFASVVFSSPELELEEDYVVTIGTKAYDFTLEDNSFYYVPSSLEDEPGGSGGPGGRQRDGASGRQRGGSSSTPGEGSATPGDVPSDSPGGSSGPDL